VVPEITITQEQSRGDSVTVRLQNLRLVSMEIDNGQETLTLDYGSISITYTPQRVQGEPSSFTASGTAAAVAPAVRSR